MLYDDTIAAIATPPGEGGIGIIRISGPEAHSILQQIFRPARAGLWRPFRMRFGHVIDPQDGIIDEALAVYMRAPRSFTAEDVAEISCHGGALVLDRVLRCALACGARQAEPGEFTMRAFLNGRIDLTQAEATLDVIQARTATGLALAQAQLAGWLATELRQVRDLLLGPLAYATALVDFPEDEVEPLDVAGPLQESLVRLERLLQTADQGLIYRQGARAVLVGLPNAGKSSLLNVLLRADRAIVTPIPGTTRDTLEETANMNGIPVVLIDTAGITETSDPVEQLGVARSRAAVAAADLALLVLDASRPPSDADIAIATLLADKPTILVLNKLDLVSELQDSDDPSAQDAFIARMVAPFAKPVATDSLNTATSPFVAAVPISALSGAGIDTLVSTIARVLLGNATTNGDRMITSPRHRDALGRATASLRDALATHYRNASPDLLAVDLTDTLTALGEVTGETVGDDLLSEIFSRFCIGK